MICRRNPPTPCLATRCFSTIIVPKSSAPCHRHLACFFTVSHSLRSCSARFGHNPNALLPSSASAGTTLINIEHAHQVQACHFLPSAVLAYRPKPMSICISLLYFLSMGRLFFHLCHTTLTNFSLPYLLNELWLPCLQAPREIAFSFCKFNASRYLQVPLHYLLQKITAAFLISEK